MVAAVAGILTSYTGNRHYVFLSRNRAVPELARFFIVYITVGLLHTAVMYILIDVMQFRVTIGFAFATSLQVLASYTFNRIYVFVGSLHEKNKSINHGRHRKKSRELKE